MRKSTVFLTALFLISIIAPFTFQRIANADGGNPPIKVAVYPSSSVASALNTHPDIEATIIGRTTIDDGGLAEFDCLIARLYRGNVTEKTIQGIQEFIDAGGGYIGEWWGAGAALTSAGESYDTDYYIPPYFLKFFSGEASDGYAVQDDNPVTVIKDHKIVKGLPDVFSAGIGTKFFVRAISPYDTDLDVLATYDGHGGTHPAIMSGRGHVKAVLIFFNAVNNPYDPNINQLLVNSVDFVTSEETEEALNVPVDIKPEGCPNKINVKSNGVIPVAILGTEDLHVSHIDQSSLRLMGMSPVRLNEEDVAAPYDLLVGKVDAFDCTDAGADGYVDLMLKFDTQEIISVLGDPVDGEILTLQLTGALKDESGGTPIEGEDVVVIIKKGKK